METERAQASIRDVLRVLRAAGLDKFAELEDTRSVMSLGEVVSVPWKVAADTQEAMQSQCQGSYGIRFTPFPGGYTLPQLQAAAKTLYEGDFCGTCGYPSTPDVLVAPCSTCGEYLCDDCGMTHYHAEDGEEYEEK